MEDHRWMYETDKRKQLEYERFKERKMKEEMEKMIEARDKITLPTPLWYTKSYYLHNKLLLLTKGI